MLYMPPSTGDCWEDSARFFSEQDSGGTGTCDQNLEHWNIGNPSQCKGRSFALDGQMLQQIACIGCGISTQGE